MGWAYMTVGEPQNARDSFQQALPLRRSAGNKRGEGLTLEGLGYAYGKLGDYPTALAFLVQAKEIFRTLDDTFGQANASFDAGDVYAALGENQKAMSEYETALSGFSKMGLKQGAGRTLIGMATVSRAEQQFDNASEYLRRALEISRAVGDPVAEASALVGFGWTSLLAGDGKEAVAHFNEALKIFQASANQMGEAGALYGLARARRTMGELSEARAHIKAAIELIETLRSRVANEKLRLSYFADKQSYYELYIQLLMEPANGTGHPALEEALNTSERAKARSLLDVLSESHADIREGVNFDLLEKRRNIQAQLNAKTELLSRLLGSKHSEEQVTSSKKAIAALLNEYESVEAEIRVNSPRYAALTQPTPLTLQQIQTRVLDRETVLLEYSLGEEKSFVWLVTIDSIQGFVLPGRSRIEDCARRTYELLTARSASVGPSSLDKHEARTQEAAAGLMAVMQELSGIILKPVATQLGNKRLLIVNDGALQYIPFSALPVPGAAQYTPLIAEHELVSLPSASVLAALRHDVQAKTPTPTTSVAVIADPVFSADDPRVARSSNGVVTKQPLPADVLRSAQESGLLDFVRLRFSRAEAEAIVKLVPENQRFKATDLAASRETAMSAAATESRILHIATHGLINSQHPELSGIVLSLVDKKGQSQNGFLRVYEIYNLKLAAEVVVLSACQTALGKQIKGEGLIGLTRGFMYAGARRVVASLWRIDDRATAELMGRFYRAMFEEHLPAAAALRSAQVSMWKEKRWSEPHFWAAFTIQGEWR
jgi:CHAT domain-containing protein/Tfp pilus assembly protein PilF